MVISGLQKMTLLDFPGKVACTVFLQGCNFRCPFCHNSPLLGANAPETIPREQLHSFLKSRKGLLDGVCITGGEPTLQKNLPELFSQIKALGYAIKLDTNGSRPEVLKSLAEQRLVDYVAMDVKNSPAEYGKTTGCGNLPLKDLEESLRFLIGGQFPYELRTTVVAELHNTKTMTDMGIWLSSLCPGRKPKKLFLQYFVDREGVLRKGLSAPTQERMAQYADILAPFVDEVHIRG